MKYKFPNTKSASRPSSLYPGEDNKSWFLDWGKYMMNQWWAGGCLVSQSGFCNWSEETIEVLRQYGRGSQSPKKYNMVVDKEVKTKDGNTYSITNISKRVPQIYPTMRERIIDRILEMRFDPQVVAIDDPSIKRRNLAYYRDKIAVSAKGKATIAATGVNPSNTTDISSIMSDKDVDILRALGGYNLATEIALTEAVRASMEVCKVHPAIARQVIEDLVDIGIGHLHVRNNALTKMQEVEYVDPAMTVIPLSQYDDCRDITWGGFLRPLSIASLRDEINRSGDKVDESKLLEVAKGYRMFMGNETSPYVLDGQYAMHADYGAGYRYDQFQVMVLTAYIVAGETETYIAGIHNSGSRLYKRVPDNTTLKAESEANGFKLNRNVVQNVYRINYVVGTDIVYGCGIDDLIVRAGLPGSMHAMIPIVSYRLNRKSITESCISEIDDLCIGIFKSRLIIANMPAPPNMEINLSALESVTQLGDLVLDPLDLLDIHRVRGYMLTSRDEYSDMPGGTPAKPFSELPDGSLALLNSVSLTIEQALSRLRDISGVNEIADGSANPTNVLTSTVNAYTTASNRALSFLYTANQSIQDMLHTQLARRYQAIAASGGATLKWVPVRTDVAKVVSITADISFGDYIIVSKPSIDKENQQMLLASVQTYKQANAIEAVDEIAATSMILRGEYLKAQFFLASAVQRKREADTLMAQQNTEAQAAAQGDAAVRIEEAKQKTMAMKGDVEAMLIEKKKVAKMELMNLQSQLGLNTTQSNL